MSRHTHASPAVVHRGPPFSPEELKAAQDIARVGRIASHAMDTLRIPHLQRRGVLSVKVVDYERGKPLWVDCRLTEAAIAAGAKA